MTLAKDDKVWIQFDSLTFSREALRKAVETAPIEKLQAAVEALEALFLVEKT